MKLLNKVKISLLISLVVIGFLSIKAFAVTGVITEITVNLREKPTTDSKRIMYVTQDDVVEVLEKDGDWYKIKAKGRTGYVLGKYVKVDESKLEEKTETPEKEETVETTKKEEVEKQEETSSTNLIIKNKTQIRIVPNISSSVIYTASKDVEINIVEQIGNWTYISVDGILGWVRTDKIVEENEVLPDEKKEEDTQTTTKKEETKKETSVKETTAYIKYDTVNLREKASTGAKVLAKLKLNDEVTVLEKVNSVWSKIKADGKTGYISTELLSDTKQEIKEETKKEDNTTTSRDGEETTRQEITKIDEKEETKKENTSSTNKNDTNSSANKDTTSKKITGEDIAEYAKKFVGCKYVSGGTSPKGFDCSGLTYYVYKNFGYKISRSSRTQAKDGVEVKKSDLQPGDLVIYKNQSLTAIGHVGIYIGDNKMVHASEPGVGVIITDIDSKPHNYDKRYVTARRIIK